ncbi:MAG: MBL fold metallo-hydrolase [Cyclobacteriaceae bacterium]
MTKTLLLLFVLTLSFAEVDAQDVISTKDGDVNIQPIVHGTLVLSWKDQTIYVDPYGGAERFEGIADPTIILITDIHGDHLNQKTLDGLNTENTQFFVPQAVMDQLPESMKSKALVIQNGETKSFANMKLRAIPMYNLPESPDAKHTKGRGNGYVLTIGGKRIYLSGDTADIPEMRGLRKIDVAFVCMNLPYTMDVNQAASAVIDFKPAIVYPYHYRGKDGLSDVGSFKKQVEAAKVSTEVRLRDWYAE